MRILFTTIPSSGHFHPLVPLARAAIAAGHEVAFACAESLCPTIAGLGLHAFASGLDRSGDGDPEFVELKKRARELAPGPELERLGVVDVIYGVRARRMLPELTTVCRSWAPDVLVHETFEAAAAVAGDQLGIPHACVEIMPLYNLEPMGEAIRAEWARLRGEAGLAPDSEMLYRHLSLCFAPPSLLDPRLPRPVSRRHFRPAFFDHGDGEPPLWLARWPERPTLYVTFGTMASTWRPDARDLFDRILRGVREEDWNVVATVGRDNDPAALGPQPDNVRIERYVPQSLLLPRCQATVNHAGFNSVMGGLAAGLPQVFVPLLADDPCNARRCTNLGLGRTIFPEELTPEAARVSVRAVLEDSRYRTRTLAMGAEMQGLPPVEAAVEELERLARGQRLSQGVAALS